MPVSWLILHRAAMSQTLPHKCTAMMQRVFLVIALRTACGSISSVFGSANSDQQTTRTSARTNVHEDWASAEHQSRRDRRDPSVNGRDL